MTSIDSIGVRGVLYMLNNRIIEVCDVATVSLIELLYNLTRLMTLIFDSRENLDAKTCAVT